MSIIIPTMPRLTQQALKNAQNNALFAQQNPTVQLPAKVPYANGAPAPLPSGLVLPQDPGQLAVAQIGQDMGRRLAGLEDSMAALLNQMSPVQRRQMTPELLAQMALSFQNFGFRPGTDNPTAPAIDGENGSIEGPVTLKTADAAATTIGTVPTDLSIEVALPDDAQTSTGGARIIAALGIVIMPSGAAANIPAGSTIQSLKDMFVDIGLVQVLVGSTIKAQYDVKDLIDTRFVQRVLEQPIRVQRGNYQAVKFRYVTVMPPAAAAASTYNVRVAFTTYWPPVRG